MVILGLDTTTRLGSAALLDGDTTRVVQGDPERTHGERLPGDLLALLREAGRGLADVDRLAVCAGPGSFTGLRLGLATAKGLALGSEVSVVGVGTLEALAASAEAAHVPSGTRLLCPCLDARKAEVYAALLPWDAATGRSSGEVLLEPRALRPAALDAGRYERFEQWLHDAGLIGEQKPIDALAVDVTRK